MVIQMKPYVITISRQFYGMGRSIARVLSRELGITFYDRDIVEETSKRLGLPISDISKLEEGAGEAQANKIFPLGKGNKEIRDKVFMTQANIISDLAKKDSCIIVGRCAEYVLKDHPRRLSVYLYAPKASRLKYCMEKLKLNEREAMKTLDAIDSAREKFRKEYGHQSDSSLDIYHLMLNSGYFGVEGSANAISKLAKALFNTDKNNLTNI